MSHNSIPLSGRIPSTRSRHRTSLDIKANFREETQYTAEIVCFVLLFFPTRTSSFSKESGQWLALLKAVHLSLSNRSVAASYRPSRVLGSVAPVDNALKWGCDRFLRTLGNMQPLDQKNHSPAAETRSATQSWRLLLCRLRPFRVKS